MALAPRVIAVSLVVSSSLWSLVIATRPDDPFSTDSAALVSIGLLMFSIIALVGLLLPRGLWARNVSRALLLVQIGLALAVPLQGLAIAALGATAISIVGIQGKWLDGWLRRLPAATGPGLKPMLFALGSLALVPAIGFSSPSGVEVRQGLLGVAGVLIAWGYSKTQPWALWTGRLALPILTILAATAAPALGAAFLIAIGFGLTALAWSEDVRLAIQPLMDSLPGPRKIKPKPDAKP